MKFTKFTELNPNWFKDHDDEVIYINMDCPCGCESKLMIPIKSKIGHSIWSVTNDSFENFTMTPSVQRLTDCKTHFSIIDGKIVP